MSVHDSHSVVLVKELPRLLTRGLTMAKVLASLLATSLMGFALSACSPPGEPSPTPVAPASTLDKTEPSAPEGTVEGEVTKVEFRPNRVEDGFYAFEVTEATGRLTYVNATGAMNLPFGHPALEGLECVEVPPAEELEGATVRFKLPIGVGADGGRAVTCFPEAADQDYFFTVVN